jgi:hypothetical protein
MERKSRAIRLSDQEWEDFKNLLGSPWLRGQIEKAKKRAKRKSTAKAVEE